MFDFLKGPRRKTLRETPLSTEQWKIVLDRVPLARKLDEAGRARLGGLMQIFLDEKNFEGGAGFVVTDEMKLVIAAEACLLLVHRDAEVPYPDLASIVVYATAWKTKRREHAGGRAVIEKEGINLGESWSKDLVVLAWDRVRADAQNAKDGHNVVLHEFAHQLDSESGGMEGAPALPSAAMYRDWARVLGREYGDLIQQLHQGHHTLLDPYASTNPAEFFAVATEFFFERPVAMRTQHPALYEQLAKFYSQDPAKNV